MDTNCRALLAERNVTKGRGTIALEPAGRERAALAVADAFDDPLLIPAQPGMTLTAKALSWSESLRERWTKCAMWWSPKEASTR